jgi:hypothetical protein
MENQGNQQVPEPFNMKDLFIDVKLEACVDGSAFDFLGRKLFSTEFFRESIGFGITNIDIEVNTSLQPLVSITFKDLYGSTMFGGQQREGSGEDKQSIDYSVLFNWPPPKFLFSFKGYLGKPASWVLNLKKTSTSFNASDGSYDLKCEFVPNQWGFFADLPFLYLIASKRLRKDKISETSSDKQKEAVTSVYDLIKIGKQVEVKTQDTTKEFDELVKQLGSIKSNTARAMSVSSVVDFGDLVDGVVNNRPVKDFQRMQMPNIKDLGETYNTKEKIDQHLGSASALKKMNLYLLLSIGFESSGVFSDGFKKFKVSKAKVLGANGDKDPDIISAKNQTLGFITKNLEKVEDEIKRLVFASSEKKLEKITIGEIFRQLAKDAAFIIGSILDAGLDGSRGNSDRQSKRNELTDTLIGQAFPMIINDKGEEVPATEFNLGQKIGVEEHEMDFVKNFINAISEGIAKDLIRGGNTPAQDDAKLLHRVNNCEMASGNPYKSSYTNIATNILVRGGIVGFMTRSNDPNLPGDYSGGFLDYFDRDGPSQIKELADRDAQNITDTIINGLSDVDALMLKRFCKFITRFYNANGEQLLQKDDDGNLVEFFPIESKDAAEHPVEMSSEPSVFLSFSTIWNELVQPSTIAGYKVTDGQLITGKVELTGGTSTSESFESSEVESLNKGNKQNAQNPLSFVNSSYTATRIENNGISYCFPNPNAAENNYWYVLFRGRDNEAAQEVNSAPTDGEYKNEDKDDDTPLGYVAFNSTTGDDGDDKLPRIELLEEYEDDDLVLDGDSIKNPNIYFYGAQIPTGATAEDEIKAIGPENLTVDQFLWKGEIVDDENAANNAEKEVIDFAGNVGWTVCHHQADGARQGLVFDLFTDSTESRNQRIFIRKVCSQLLLDIDKLEDERDQVLGSVLGKAGEQEDSIYKQMHTLYHQWQALSYSGEKVKAGSLCGDKDEYKGAEGGDKAKTFGVAEALEKKYGNNHTNMFTNETVEIENPETLSAETLSLVNREQSNGVPDGTFIYDYPLQRIRALDGEPVQVKDSIINLESLYKANGETSVLNIIQQVCTKNNFLFVPIPGNPDYLNVNNIYSAFPEPANIDIKNFFHILFTPTPESRSTTRNSDGTALALSKNQENYNTNSFVIKYGHPDNQIVSNISVGTDDTEVTAESIVNLQRLVDNDNQNKKVTTDCSMLPVLAGRSYKASVDMLGNAQVYPMQFFYLKNSPLFGGLYQVMKVKHSISPNDFKTTADGIRMRFSPGDGYGAIKPITLQTFRDLGAPEAPLAVGKGFDDAERKAFKEASTASTISIVTEGDNTPVGDYDKTRIEKAVKDKGHKWFDTKGDYELNIVGIRNTTTGSAVTNLFDDFITLSYKVDGKWKFWSWKCTTQPGKSYMDTPLRADGTAIMKPGQYINSHSTGLHAGKYEAMRQTGALTVYRDANKDSNYDLDESKVQTGYFGVNIHRSSPSGTSSRVNNWSAGCQVFSNINDFNQFMNIVRAAKAAHGNKFTYTLLLSSDIPGESGSTTTENSGDYTNIITELNDTLNVT